MQVPNRPIRLQLEPLESRRAPATLSADGKTITFTDTDGDAATVALSKPVLNAGNVNGLFTFDTGTVDGSNTALQQLLEINLTGLPAGLSVNVSATAAGGGDGKVNVGWVNATGKDVGSVTLSGDLGRITAGDANTKSPGLAGLGVGSLGVKGVATQPGVGSLESDVVGKLPKLAVTGDVQGASVVVTGGADGKIGDVTIGGNLVGDATVADTGKIQASGSMGNVLITGSVSGGDGAYSGFIGAATKIKSVTIGGSVVGRGGHWSGGIRVKPGDLGAVKIGGDLTGGGGNNSGAVQVYDTKVGKTLRGGHIASVTVTGNVTAGTGPYSAYIFASNSIGTVKLNSLTGGPNFSGGVHADNAIGGITVTGNVTGGAGYASGLIFGGRKIKSITIGGNLTGGGGSLSGSIHLNGGNLGPVLIVGNVVGGSAGSSGAIDVYAGAKGTGKITSITVTGDVIGGTGPYSALLYAAGNIGAVSVGSFLGGDGYESSGVESIGGKIKSVTVHGDVVGGKGNLSAQIVAGGNLGPVAILGNGGSRHGDLTGGVGKLSAMIIGKKIASVTIAGNVSGGSGAGSASIKSKTNLGKVSVAGNWTGASIGAGVNPGADNMFGTADDKRVKATIAGITIGGTVSGTAAAGDTFAFVATSIKKFTLNGGAQALKPGPANDDILLDATNNDIRLIELLPT